VFDMTAPPTNPSVARNRKVATFFNCTTVAERRLYCGADEGSPRQNGGITSEEEEEQLETLNDWMDAQGLPRGVLGYDFADTATGEQKALFDLAWPNGIQEELSQPVAVLLNEGTETIATARQAGYRCFTSLC
jgi:hypothetical protein